MAKPWKQQALILVAALLLGLSLPVPGSAAPLEEACSRGLQMLPDIARDPSCIGTVFGSFGTIRATSEEDVRKCCSTLQDVGSSGDDCTCNLREAFAQKNIDVDRVCKLRMTKEECQAKADDEKAKADAARQRAKQREAELSKLGACDRLFERLVAREESKISRDKDIMACRQEMKTCPADCKGKQ